MFGKYLILRKGCKQLNGIMQSQLGSNVLFQILLEYQYFKKTAYEEMSESNPPINRQGEQEKKEVVF